jgi:hypothetical protein
MLTQQFPNATKSRHTHARLKRIPETANSPYQRGRNGSQKNMYKKIMSDKGNYSSRADVNLDAVSSDHPGYHETRSSTKAKDKRKS